jgi:hypothetical protein
VDTTGLPIRCQLSGEGDPCSAVGMACVSGTCQAQSLQSRQPFQPQRTQSSQPTRTSQPAPSTQPMAQAPRPAITPAQTMTPVTQGAAGATCKSDTDCMQGFCIAQSALGLGGTRAGSVCGSACCEDSDCPSGSVCFSASTGARACLPTTMVGRERGDVGQACTRSSQCSSSTCQSGKCTATCTHDADCPGEACRLNVLASNLGSGAAGFVCGPAIGRGNPGDLCTGFDPTACVSGLCAGAQCVAPCGADADCTDGRVCSYVTVTGLLGTGRVSACVPADQVPAPPAPTCCTNADCSSQHGACVPMGSGNEWGMYCGALSMVQ